MSSIAVLHTAAQPDAGATHDIRQSIVHGSNAQREAAEWTGRGWVESAREQIRLSPSEGGRLTEQVRVTFARPRYMIGDRVLWHRPTNESESPISVLPAIVMGQFADGPYQLFVCSFQGAHIQVAAPDQVVPIDDAGKELVRRIGRDLAAIREAYDVASRYQIAVEERLSKIEARLEGLEAAATRPDAPKHGRKDG